MTAAFSPRELQIVQRIVSGQRPAEIAPALADSPPSRERHRADVPETRPHADADADADADA